jgi:voltage-gated potassium channel
MLRPGRSRWAQKLYVVIFEADTPVGKAFDVALLLAIMVGLLVVSLDSVNAIAATHGRLLARTEWILSALFSIEYVLRLVCLRKPLRYAFSFFGLVDLLSLLPTYMGLFFPGAKSLVVIRSLRLLRAFRVLKLARYVGESEVLWAAIRASSRKAVPGVDFNESRHEG